MRTIKPLHLLCAFAVFGLGYSVNAQDVQVKKAKSKSLSAQQSATAQTQTMSSASIIPFDQAVAGMQKANPKGAKQLKKWARTKHFQISKNGNFIPFDPSKAKGGNTTASAQNLSEGTNCAQVKCPPVFEEGVICWKCM